ncbi:hypothetical protein IMSHALPRED_004429 [Imshaugia aleurites]|uniref:Glycosyltransferase n=1 Tax=Imshaugia aleurites TaxID=172621 RepID=A0A8H3IKI9_9LECA|nr:hypothetical protein IMSHALPRED_004429 [Imshaugia aleurites]
MLSPQPIVYCGALLSFAFFQFYIFRIRVPDIARIDQSITNTPSLDAPTLLEHNETAADLRLPDQSITNTLSVDVPTPFEHNEAAADPLLPDVLRPRIRQVSMRVYNATNETNDALDARCMATHLEYGKRWGYPTHILRQDLSGKGEWRDLLFCKPLYLLSLTIAEMAKPPDERAEWLVFFDSDTILLNPNIPWTLFLPPSDFSQVHFLGGRDWGGGSGFNAGVFFVRISEWSVKMLTEVAALPDLRKDVPIGDNAEQVAFRWVFVQVGYRERVLYQPVEWFNSFEDSHGHLPPVQDGEMLVHFSGLKKHKFGAERKWLDRLERAPHELQIPLENTNYQVNIDAYWTRLRDARDTMQEAEQFRNGNYTTRNIRLAKAKLQQIVYDEANNSSLVLEAINQVKSALATAEFNPADGRDMPIAATNANIEFPAKRPQQVAWVPVDNKIKRAEVWE